MGKIRRPSLGDSLYDDNFGPYNIENEKDLEYYENSQEKSIEKECQGCHETVKILPDYTYCNIYTEKIDQGWDPI